jgi:mannose-6-phosphate isomerase-like protein (cupin superfamily)
MNRVFSIKNPIRVPDGTIVYPFLNPKDSTSELPWDLIDDFSISAGEIEARVKSKIHVMPLVTQVTFVLSGSLEVRMKDPGGDACYALQLGPEQAVITRPGTFFQLINHTNEPCRVLYIVSPAYLFELDASGNVVYDDSIVLDEDWDELARLDWQPAKLKDTEVMAEERRQAAERLAARSRQGEGSTRDCGI